MRGHSDSSDVWQSPDLGHRDVEERQWGLRWGLAEYQDPVPDLFFLFFFFFENHTPFGPVGFAGNLDPVPDLQLKICSWTSPKMQKATITHAWCSSWTPMEQSACHQPVLSPRVKHSKFEVLEALSPSTEVSIGQGRHRQSRDVIAHGLHWLWTPLEQGIT